MPDEAVALLRKAREEKALRLTAEKYRYFVPTGAGEQFLNLAFSGSNFISLLNGANGIGKTYLMANALANLFYPCGNEWMQQPLMKKWKFPRVGRIISDHTVVEHTVVRHLLDVFPAGKYTADKAGRAFESKWKINTGWEFDIMTTDQDPKEFEGATLGWVWFDEPPPEAIYKATVARLRKGGVIIITATPLAGSAWLYDHLVLKKNYDGVNIPEGQRSSMEANIESACEIHGVRGFLEHEQIVRMTSEYSEDEKWARAFGKFHHLTGLVFKKFSRQIHTVRPFNVDSKDFVVAEYIDPHPRNPDAVLWVAVDKDGTHFVVNELFGKYVTEELVERIKAKEEGYRIISRKGDPSMFIVDKHTGKSLASEMGRLGLTYEPAPKERSLADRMIGDFLDYDTVGNQMLRKPRLYFFDTCERSIFEMEHYRWQDWKGRTGDEKDPMEKPVDRDDHMVECAGRALVDRHAWFPYVPATYRSSQSPPKSDDPYA